MSKQNIMNRIRNRAAKVNRVKEENKLWKGGASQCQAPDCGRPAKNRRAAPLGGLGWSRGQ
jgi:hypothetical protein